MPTAEKDPYLPPHRRGAIQVGNVCVSARKTFGVVRKIIVGKNGRKIYLGHRVIDKKKRWRSVRPIKLAQNLAQYQIIYFPQTHTTPR